MEAEQAANKTLSLLKKQYPDAVTALSFGKPIELLVATILSAQCTDARVNMVTKELFKKYKTVSDYAHADLKKFEQEIRSTGFFHNKAKNIINASKLLEEKFHGKVPKTMAELMTLPGVARKTANIVLSEAYGIIEGIAVDTHVRRLSQRIGLSKNKDPNKIEQDLMKLAPRSEWRNISNVLIFHGRRVCIARKPKCEICVLNKFCISAFKINKKA
jgi:endonuclease-3